MQRFVAMSMYSGTVAPTVGTDQIVTGGCDAAARLYAANETTWEYYPSHQLRVIDYHCPWVLYAASRKYWPLISSNTS